MRDAIHFTRVLLRSLSKSVNMYSTSVASSRRMCCHDGPGCAIKCSTVGRSRSPLPDVSVLVRPDAPPTRPSELNPPPLLRCFCAKADHRSSPHRALLAPPLASMLGRRAHHLAPNLATLGNNLRPHHRDLLERVGPDQARRHGGAQGREWRLGRRVERRARVLCAGAVEPR